MVCRLITGLSFGLLAICSTGLGVAADPRTTLVATVLQDEPRVLPEESAAYFARSDRRLRFQLAQLGDSPAALLAGTPVTVVTPQGESRQLTADAQGVATLSDVTAGLHAVVVAGPAGHAAIPVAVRERPEVEVAEDDVAVPHQVSTVRLPLVTVDPREALRVASSFLPAPATLASFADLDDQLIAEGEVAPIYRSRIRLGAGGRLEGQVYSLMRPDYPTAGVAGTNVMIYRGDQLAARAVADELGRFSVENLVPGNFGLIAAGPGGYAAFAFEAIATGELVDNAGEETLVSTGGASLVRANQGGAASDVLPVLLIPQPMLPAVMDAIRQGALGPAAELAVPLGGFSPFAGAGFAAGGGGGGFGAEAGVGNLGGLLALAGLAGALVAIADDSDDDAVVPIATPALLSFPSR